MFRQTLIDILFYTGLPASLLIYAAGLWKKRYFLGFLLGYTPLILLWLLLLPDLFPAFCPAPCDTAGTGLESVIGVSLLHLVFYNGATSLLYLVIYFLIDPATAVIRKSWQKGVVLLQMGLLGLVGAIIIALNLEFVLATVLMLGSLVLGALSHTWWVVGIIILLVMAIGAWVGIQFYTKSNPK